jgi:orotate phosphoribosyltransferase
VDKREIEGILKRNGVLLEGHFLLTSGRHSDKYMQCANIFCTPLVAKVLCAELAAKWADVPIDVVVGPAVGAVIMSYEMARQLDVRDFFAERVDGEMRLKRFALKGGENVLVVEDVTTTGGSVREVMEVVRAAGGNVVGVGAIVDRTAGEIDFGVPFKAVYSTKVESYEAAECPLCKEGKIPLVSPGRAGKRQA